MSTEIRKIKFNKNINNVLSCDTFPVILPIDGYIIGEELTIELAGKDFKRGRIVEIEFFLLKNLPLATSLSALGLEQKDGIEALEKRYQSDRVRNLNEIVFVALWIKTEKK